MSGDSFKLKSLDKKFGSSEADELSAFVGQSLTDKSIHVNSSTHKLFNFD